MKNTLRSSSSRILTVGAIALALGLSTNSFALAQHSSGFKVAVVDVQKVVVSSPQVNALRVEQKNKIDSLIAFVEKAKADLAKESNEAKKKSLEEGYNKELNVKKQAIDKEYSEKLLDIDKNITNIIQAKAKSDKYDLVLIKSSVLQGGVDITSEIVKLLK